MRKILVLLGSIAGAALTLGSVQSNAGSTTDGYNAIDSHAAANIMLADNSQMMRDDGGKPAMGGEGDDAMGGNAPNPNPDRSASTVADDASITSKVKTELLADTMVSGMKIDVDTRNRVVYLTGDNMNSQAAIDQAMRIAQRTAGVDKVVSKLAVGDVKS